MESSDFSRKGELIGQRRILKPQGRFAKMSSKLSSGTSSCPSVLNLQASTTPVHEEFKKFDGYDEDAEIEFRKCHGEPKGALVSPDIVVHGEVIELCQTTPTLLQPSFMIFPPELRVMIYKLLLISKTPTVIPCPRGEIKGNSRTGRVYITRWFSENSGIYPAICRTCRSIAGESLKVLYNYNTLHMTYVTCDIFIRSIGQNKLRVHSATIEYMPHYSCKQENSPSADNVIDDVYHSGFLISSLKMLSNLRHLSITFEKGGSGQPCSAYLTALTAIDSDVVVNLLKSKFHSLESLKMEGFPAETLQYILSFLQSEQVYATSSEPDIKHSITTPPKRIRPLPLQACLTCENCKCAGVKPVQLDQLKDALKLVHTQLSSGGTAKIDKTAKELLQRMVDALL